MTAREWAFVGMAVLIPVIVALGVAYVREVNRTIRNSEGE